MGFLKKKASPLGCHQPKADTGDYAPPGVKFVSFVLTSQGIRNVKVCHHLQ